jgi:methylmalonyl-CoA epimerase
LQYKSKIILDKWTRRERMIYKIDHIGIAVKSIEKALEFYNKNLQIECTKVEYIKGQKSRVAFLPVGNTEIELLESMDSDSTIKKFIDKRGEGIHHIAFKVNSLKDEMERLKSLGLTFISENESYKTEEAKIAFLHPKLTGGVLVELFESEA